ncbi:MAG: alcohol dehydrogenase catalytic domain-containing protein [Ruminococcaceae bacterium]|nr:alcohol dehydrogenase catalytic domain-containing protein [Oscillospiraceae bacterium]
MAEKRTMQALLKRDLTPGILIEEVPIPQPDDDQVLLKVRAAGICGSDVHMYEGDASYKVFENSMPVILGHEFSAEVVQVGGNVQGIAPGQRVVVRPRAPCGQCHYCKTNRRHMCTGGSLAHGLRIDGGFAEYVVTWPETCIPLPDNISDTLGALIEPFGIAANAVHDGGLNMGESLVIQGPGPIGLLALIVAKARGVGNCIVIGTSRDTLRLERAKAFGANHVVIADQVDAVQAVRDLTDGRGADMVIEASGVPALLQTALDMCDKMGRVVVAGIYAGPAQVDFTAMVRGGKSLIGTYGGLVAWERILAWLSANPYYAQLSEDVITHRSHLADADAAFKRSVNKENIKEVFIFN